MEHISTHINQLQPVQKSLAPVKAECGPLPIGEEEQKLALAVQETKIAHLGNIEPLKQALRYAMVLIGLREKNWPTEAEKTLLINFIQKHFGGHTPSEIKLAFDLAVSGHLPVEVNCYENFSVLYVSSIMNAYQSWCSEAIKHAVKEKPVQTLAPEWLLDFEIACNDASAKLKEEGMIQFERILDDWYQHCIGDLESFLQLLGKTKTVRDILMHSYHEMIGKNLIKEIEALDHETKMDLWNEAKRISVVKEQNYVKNTCRCLHAFAEYVQLKTERK